MNNSGFRSGVGFALGVLFVGLLAWMFLRDPKGVVVAGGLGLLIAGGLVGIVLLIVLLGKLSYKRYDLGSPIAMALLGVLNIAGLPCWLFPNAEAQRQLALIGKIGGWSFIGMAVLGLVVQFFAKQASEPACPHEEWEQFGWFKRCRACGHKEPTEFQAQEKQKN